MVDSPPGARDGGFFSVHRKFDASGARGCPKVIWYGGRELELQHTIIEPDIFMPR